MSYQSEIEINSARSCYGKGVKIIDLIDNLMLDGWVLGVEGQIFLIDKGDEFHFTAYKPTLSSFHKAYELISYKENKMEFIKIDLSHIESSKAIEMLFDPDKRHIIKIILLDENKNLRLLNPAKEISRYCLLLYDSIDRWGRILSIKYRTDYDNTVIKVFEGENLFEQIEKEAQ